MLIGISPCISPDLLSVLHRMGHGDEIVLGDAFFCGDTFGQRVLRADGIRIHDLLDGILSLMNLDESVQDSLVIMRPSEGDSLDPDMEELYRGAIERHWAHAPDFTRMERFAFYERAKKSFAVVMTGELFKYGNIILKKGVVPVERNAQQAPSIR